MSEATARRPTTIRDVAAAAGVSRAAVSKVIRDAHGVSPEMRARVQDAITRLNYRPSAAARSMRGASFTLGIEMPHLVNPFLVDIAEGARGALSDTPYQLVVAPAGSSEHWAIEALIDHRVDGIVAVSPLVPAEWLEELSHQVPLVMIGRHDNSIGYDTVVGNDRDGARQIMDHLFELGHRRIAHLTERASVADAGTGTPHAVRLETYLQCMRDAGADEHIRVVHVENEEPGGRAATEMLLRQAQPPTAIFAAHDLLAMGALAAVADAGLSAKDVSVAGYDGTAVAAHPLVSLTSVHQPGSNFGSHAVAMLLERIRGRVEPRHETLTGGLVIRSSTAPPPCGTN